MVSTPSSFGDAKAFFSSSQWAPALIPSLVSFASSVVYSLIVPETPTFAKSWANHVAVSVFPRSLHTSTAFKLQHVVSVTSPTGRSEATKSNPEGQTSVVTSIDKLGSGLFALVDNSKCFGQVRSYGETFDTHSSLRLLRFADG